MLDPSKYDVPLVPLMDAPTASSSPGYIPSRPASHPNDAPFGHEWNSQHGTWNVETSAFPAAFPRSIDGSVRDAGTRATAAPSSSSARLSKEELDKIRNEMFDNRVAAGKKPAKEDGPNKLWLTVNKYYPAQQAGHKKASTSRQDPVTLIFAHANGFSKETWEPTLAHLIASWDTEKQGELAEIWVLDMINQGDAAVLNKDVLGNTFDWADNGRDILQFILSYLPEASGSAASTPSAHQDHNRKATTSGNLEDPSISHWADKPSSHRLPTKTPSTPEYKRGVTGWTTEDPATASVPHSAQSASSPGKRPNTFRPKFLSKQPLPSGMSDLYQLDRSSHSSSKSKLALSQPAHARRWRGRRIVLVGHSVGAAGMTFASSTFPQLFESLILVDPTMFSEDTPRWPATSPLVNGAIIRRTGWKSREEALQLFAKNKGFYGKWDKDVLAGYVQYGLLDDGNGKGVSLKVDRMQEAYVYADVDNYGSKRAFHRLSYLPASINVHIVRADAGLSTIPEDYYAPFHDITKHATHTRIKDAAHLIAQEKPEELAEELVGYLRGLEIDRIGIKAKL